MQGLNKLGHDGPQIVFGHWGMAFVGHEFERRRRLTRRLALVASCHLSRGLRFVGMYLQQSRPIFRASFQSPEIFRVIQPCGDLPALLTRAHGLAVHNMGHSRAASLAPKLHRDAGLEFRGRKNGAAMSADHQGLANFGEGRAWLQAGDGDGKGDRHSRAAPYGVGHIRTMHSHPSFKERAPLTRGRLKLCTHTVPQASPFTGFQ